MTDTSPRDTAALLWNAKRKAARVPKTRWGSLAAARPRRPGAIVRATRQHPGRRRLRRHVARKRRTAVLAPLRGRRPRAIRRGEHDAGFATNWLGGRGHAGQDVIAARPSRGETPTT